MFELDVTLAKWALRYAQVLACSQNSYQLRWTRAPKNVPPPVGGTFFGRGPTIPGLKHRKILAPTAEALEGDRTV